MMKYKGYVGRVEYDSEAQIFHGEVVGLKDIITFQGTNAKEVEQAFEDSVNDYLEWCKERGEKPEKTFSGKLNLRMSPDLHAYLALEAAQRGVSLNELITQKLSRS